jgi:hypothetical protein
MAERGAASDVLVKTLPDGQETPCGILARAVNQYLQCLSARGHRGTRLHPIHGISAAMHYFVEHKGPTDPTNPAFWQVGSSPFDDPNRVNQNPRQAIPKTFINTDPASVNYVRANSATAKIYPYVTNVIPTGPTGSFPVPGRKVRNRNLGRRGTG